MVLDNAKKEQILETFKKISEYKELSRGHNVAASDQMKGLVESLSADKQERKTIKKILSKALREWEEKQKGEEDTIVEALEVLEQIEQ